jgi:hypothetical protein
MCIFTTRSICPWLPRATLRSPRSPARRNRSLATGEHKAALRTPAEPALRFARWPGAVEQAVQLRREYAFHLCLIARASRTFPHLGIYRAKLAHRAGEAGTTTRHGMRKIGGYKESR